MPLTNKTNNNYTLRQLKLPLEMEKLIDISDPVYTFCEVMDHIDLSRYFVEKGCKTGRPRCDEQKLLKVILFAFMEHGICSLRYIEKLCRNDIRYMYLLDGMKAPSFATFGNMIRKELTDSIEQIFLDINTYIFEKDHVDLQHTYIDGTKIEANANRYTWVWKKSCTKNRGKVFKKISTLIDAMNQEVLGYLNVKLEKREEYAIDYVSELLEMYRKVINLDESTFVSGCGHRKSIQQKQYQELQGYLERLKTYAHHIEVCGEERNSYSKTDHDATFMRLKRDYMGNDQLLPAYNLQTAVCDEYIAAVDVKPYASDMECFVPLLEKFNKSYGHYPKYPVADAGYGSYNNYLYCEEHGMEKYMKFTMFKKETTDKKYHENPYRAVNFKQDESGNLICPNGKKFYFKSRRHVYKNKYGRTEEIYECETCEGCQYKSDCCPKASHNRTIHMNQELTSIHKEVISNLESIHGALLRMNRSIQAEGTFGVLKWDKSYKRLFRRGEKNVILELTLISCGFNLYKYHNKKQRKGLAA
ncbi:MAG: transposase [Clostridium cadaveris]|nr:transposase [Clostridium cadaveris]MDY4948810.1 transposase [Clostridium cadaveris]